MASKYPGALRHFEGTRHESDIEQDNREIFYITDDEALRYKDEDDNYHYYYEGGSISPSGIDEHIADSGIHFEISDINILSSQVNDFDISVSGNIQVEANTLKETNIAHPLVETAVPSGALFTDTIYDDSTISGILYPHVASGDIHFIESDISHLNIQDIGVNTHNQIDEKINLISYADSPMIIQGGMLSSGTNPNTFKITALSGYLRTTNDILGELVLVTLPEQDNITIPNSGITYTVGLDYNDGTTQIITSVGNPYTTDKTIIPIGTIFNQDGTIHNNNGGFRYHDLGATTQIRARTLRTLELANGCIISYTGTNNLAVANGVIYGGLNRFETDTYTSVTDTFTTVRSDGLGGWLYEEANVIDFEHYDVGDGTLGLIGVAKYGNFWVYIHPDDGHIFVRYGVYGSDRLAVAEDRPEPNSPPLISDFGALLGTAIIPQIGGEFTLVQMVTDTFFSGSASSHHGDLTGLDDDDHAQYILVNGSRDFTNPIGGITPTISGHLTTKSYVDDLVASGSVDLGDHSIDELNDVDTSTDTPSKNEVLKWNGTDWVPAAYNASFTFSISSFLGTPTTTPNLIGNDTWKATGELSFAAVYANGPATGGYITYTEWSDITMSGVGYVGPTLNDEIVTYPTVGSYRQMILHATDGETPTTKTETYYFYNMRYYGVDTNTTLTETDIEALTGGLSNSRVISFTVTAAVGEYIWYSYPTRLGTATFSVGGFEGGFESPDTVSVTNANGYIENYYTYRSTNSGLGTTTVGVS